MGAYGDSLIVKQLATLVHAFSLIKLMRGGRLRGIACIGNIWRSLENNLLTALSVRECRPVKPVVRMMLVGECGHESRLTATMLLNATDFLGLPRNKYANIFLPKNWPGHWRERCAAVNGYNNREARVEQKNCRSGLKRYTRFCTTDVCSLFQHACCYFPGSTGCLVLSGYFTAALPGRQTE